MDNLDIYRQVANVPPEAQKPITGGNLKGMTDINPMWRIKTLTEIFGPCGLGWYTQIIERWTERDVNESTAWVKVALYVKFPGTDTWSMPIEGVGGSKQCGKGKGDGINDEAFKMAETDAISVACKKLGVGASVYWNRDITKYSALETKGSKTETKRTVKQVEGSKPTAEAQPVAAQPVEDVDPMTLEKFVLDDAIRDVNDAKTPEELTDAWNRWKPVFGDNVELRKAVATSPANPKKHRSNG